MNDTKNEEQSPYTLIGKEPGVRALLEEFYYLMNTLPIAQPIRAMHKGDLGEMTEKLTVFLIGWMGGPQTYTQRFGRVIIPEVHQSLNIGEGEAEQWLLCMRQALEKSILDELMLERLMGSFSQMAHMCRTH